ncbi:hypothetical protein O181_048281 [Austropuccinia psidii MF-1]|uniref:Uncharacterized protein n=1 Tax=Austropuccinia psidii MF-1 TaxID=1389203 RepID=A0A9Q3DXQ2_9BASI|nr:hypothetical protein [Austropuccinia psidii MF-1]
MRQDHGKHDWSWWRSEVITKWANNSWRSKLEKAFESAILNSENDKPLTWFFKQKDKLSALHPDMSDTMINMKISRGCGGELEHAIKCRCVEPCSTDNYVISMEDIITRKRIGITWTKIPMESKMVPKISGEDRRPGRPVLKLHKCGSISNLANNCPKKTKINEVQIIEEVQCTEEKEESDLDYPVSEDTTAEDYPIENIRAFFEVTELHTHLPQYREDFNNLINIQDARMCRTKPARGKVYTAGASCITSILMNDIEGKVNLDTGAFCTCVGKDYLQAILPGSKIHLLPIEGVQLGSSSNNMYPLAQIDASLSPNIRHELDDVLYTYNNTFASDNEPYGTKKGNEVDINLNIDRTYPPVLTRPAYPARPRAREALEKHTQEFIQLGVLRKVGHNEEVEVTTPVIIAWNNHKSRMVGDFGALNTYTVPDRYPIPRIQETLTQLSKDKYITSMDALKGFHQKWLDA